MPYIRMIPLLLLACAAYLYKLHEPSYWFDETISLEMSRNWDALWARLLSYEVNMWLYYIQLHFLQQGSQLEFYTRSLSVGFSLLSVAVLYVLSFRLFKNRQIAIISSLVMAINPFMLRYAQETRGYSETLFFGTLASYILVRGEESQRKIWWMLYGICITIGLYLHLFIIWIALAHAIWLLSLKRQSWENWFIGAAVAGAGVLSVLILQPIFRSSQVDWIPPFELEHVRVLLVNLTGYSRSLQLLYIFSLILALVYYFFKRPDTAAQRFLWLTFLVPILGTIAVSLGLRSLFIDRYFIIILAPAAILIAFGASLLPRRWIVAIFMSLILFASLRSIYYTVEDRIKRPHASIREVIVYLSENATTEDLIVVQRNHTRLEVIGYYSWRFNLLTPIQFEDENGVFGLDESYSQLWLLYMTKVPPDNLETNLDDYRFVETIEFNGLMLWHYESEP